MVELPKEAAVTRKRPTWIRETLREVEKHVAPNNAFKESKRPHKFLSYMALTSHIISSEPSSYEQEIVQ